MTGYESKRAMAQDKIAQEPVRECNSIDCQYIDGLGKTDCEWCRPKKSTPPQRPWVGLTDMEWFEWWRESKVADETEAEIDFADFLIIAQAVLAKLKEKNNGT